MIITKYGLPQAAVFPLVIILIAAGLIPAAGQGWFLPAEAFLGILLLWALSFFRDPPRKIPSDENCFVSPSDGVVTDVSFTEENPLGEKALKIGVFLSLFNVHINRVPCEAEITSVAYKKGGHINAMSLKSGRVNESNNVFMTRLREPKTKLLVRQISGAIARHIVCEAAPGKIYRRGETFGMIKFGSRTELYLACKDPEELEITVKPGDRVKAGASILIRYKHEKV